MNGSVESRGGNAYFKRHRDGACSYDGMVPKPFASLRVVSAADSLKQPCMLVPAHKGLKSSEPAASARALSGATAAVASGNAGASGFMGPRLCMAWFTMPRAGLPVKMLVSAVVRGGVAWSALRCSALVVAS